MGSGVGTIVQTKKHGLLVVAEMKGDEVTRFETLKDHVSGAVVIKYGGEWKSIKEIVEKHCEEYLSNNELVYWDETEE